MAVFALTNAYAFAAGYDFTTDSNQLALNVDVAQLDKTTFGDTWTEFAGGLRSSAFSMGGFFQSAADQAPDPQAFNGLGVADRVFTFGPDNTEGQTAYLWQAMKSQYTLGGQVGDLAPFTLQAGGSNGVGVVHGSLAKARGTVSATGALGTGLNLGAVSASQYLYATFHVFSAATTITVQVQSDDNSGFTSPTTRGTIGPLTTTGGTWMTRVAGSITDTWWRFNVSAITGSFIVAGSIGIQ